MFARLWPMSPNHVLHPSVCHVGRTCRTTRASTTFPSMRLRDPRHSLMQTEANVSFPPKAVCLSSNRCSRKQVVGLQKPICRLAVHETELPRPGPRLAHKCAKRLPHSCADEVRVLDDRNIRTASDEPINLITILPAHSRGHLLELCGSFQKESCSSSNTSQCDVCREMVVLFSAPVCLGRLRQKASNRHCQRNRHTY
jgi:hypothetical protein